MLYIKINESYLKLKSYEDLFFYGYSNAWDNMETFEEMESIVLDYIDRYYNDKLEEVIWSDEDDNIKYGFFNEDDFYNLVCLCDIDYLSESMYMEMLQPEPTCQLALF